MKRPIKLLIVDDHPLVRKGVALCLAGNSGITIIGETGEAREVLPLTRKLNPNVVLMDIDLPNTSGLDLARQLQAEHPDIKVMILSVHENPETIRLAMQAGARGYFSKHASPADLGAALEAVHRGDFYYTAEMVGYTLPHAQNGHGHLGADGVPLTSREQEVLVRIAEGCSNKEIAARLGVSARTVEFHRGHLRSKLKLHSAASLTRFAVARGMVSAEAAAQ